MKMVKDDFATLEDRVKASGACQANKRSSIQKLSGVKQHATAVTSGTTKLRNADVIN